MSTAVVTSDRTRSRALTSGGAIRRLRTLFLLAAALATVSVALPASTASATSGSAWIHQFAGRSASGAAVILDLSLVCPRGASYGVTTSAVYQRLADGSLASGSGTSTTNAGGECDGSLRTIRITAISEKKPFALGAAFATASVSVCTPTCFDRTVSRTVSIQANQMNQLTYSSPTLTLAIPQQGTFEANGAGAVVRIPYRCGSAFRASVMGTLAQRKSSAVLSAGTEIELTCSDSNRVGVLALHAPAYPWRLGDAFLRLDGSVCNDYDACTVGSFAWRTLNLVKPT